MNNCIYCGYLKGSTKEHIIPRALLTNLKLHAHMTIDPPEHNVAPCCEWCNHTKASRVILPTPGHIMTEFANTPAKYLQSVAEWVAFNKNELRDFFENEKHREFYGVEQYEIDTVVTLYWNNYYERLTDNKRNIPYNLFCRDTLLKGGKTDERGGQTSECEQSSTAQQYNE